MNPYSSPGLNWKPKEAEIFSRVAKIYGLKPVDIMKKTRKQPIPEARQYVVYLLKKELKYTNKQAKNVVGFKNTATAIHASKVIKNRIELKQLWYQLKH